LKPVAVVDLYSARGRRELPNHRGPSSPAGDTDSRIACLSVAVANPHTEIRVVGTSNERRESGMKLAEPFKVAGLDN